jgi:hypothetical protein
MARPSYLLLICFILAWAIVNWLLHTQGAKCESFEECEAQVLSDENRDIR